MFLESVNEDELNLYMCLFVPLIQVYNSAEDKTQMLIGKNIQNVYIYNLERLDANPLFETEDLAPVYNTKVQVSNTLLSEYIKTIASE